MDGLCGHHECVGWLDLYGLDRGEPASPCFEAPRLVSAEIQGVSIGSQGGASRAALVAAVKGHDGGVVHEDGWVGHLASAWKGGTGDTIGWGDGH